MRDRLGVIESLSAGYRFLGKRLYLLLVPILLDLLLWLAPRLSIAPLFRQIADFYSQAATMDGMPTDMLAASSQLSELLDRTGETSNLFSLLVNSSLLHVPSLLASINPIGEDVVRQVENPLIAILIYVGFSLLGVLVGVVYMNMLASALPLGGAPKLMRLSEFVGAVLRHWMMVLLYVVLLVLALLIGSIPIALAIALLSMISSFLGPIILLLLSGTLLVVFFYLYFVTAAMVLDNLPVHRAIAQSFVVVRANFWATLGFVVLYNVITIGFALLMTSLARLTPVATLAAILLYAYIGSGLTMALLVFYRTRILKHEEQSHFLGIAS
jgi:hypothetical protein